MKALKIIVIALVALAALVTLAVTLLLKNINPLVKEAVETLGPEILKVPVTLNEVDIRLRDGRGELHGLSIGNPKGYQGNELFGFKQIALDLDPSSLTKEVKVIDEILIDGISLSAEFSQDFKQSNLQSLMDGMGLNTGSQASSQSASTAAAQPAAEQSPEILLAVKRFHFADTQFKVLTEQWGEKRLSLPALTLSQLGSAKQGLTPEQLARSALDQWLNHAKKSAKEALNSLLEDELKAKAEAKKAELKAKAEAKKAALKAKADSQKAELKGKLNDKLKSLF